VLETRRLTRVGAMAGGWRLARRVQHGSRNGSRSRHGLPLVDPTTEAKLMPNNPPQNPQKLSKQEPSRNPDKDRSNIGQNQPPKSDDSGSGYNTPSER
jgi:hypothetical protein